MVNVIYQIGLNKPDYHLGFNKIDEMFCFYGAISKKEKILIIKRKTET